MFPIDDEPNTRIFPLFTIGIIALNIFAFYLELTSPNLEAFIMQYALIPASVTLGDVSTLAPFVTSMFLHAGFGHIISNMLFLWIFGDNIEEIYGKTQFLIIYLGSGLIAAFSQYMLIPNSPYPMLGASGAVAGILGAYIIRFPGSSIKTIIPPFFLVPVPAFLMIGIWFFTQVFNGLSIIGIDTAGGVAWWAHIGGFIAGMALSLILPHHRFDHNPIIDKRFM